MKILVIGFTKLKYMPYIHFYLNQICTTDNELQVFYWNRDESEDSRLSDTITLIPFFFSMSDELNKGRKILPFLKFRRHLMRFLKKKDFDRIIILHSLPGVLIGKYLMKHYNKRFILDYRDSTYEFNWLFLRRIHELVRSSFATFVSSDAFRRYMPRGAKNVYTSHNLLLDSLSHQNTGRDDASLPIVISFWGLIRHFDINKVLIQKVACDRRFELHYFGRAQNTAYRLRAFAEEIEAVNVFFHGEYLPEERYAFARKTSLIHNLYDNQDFNMINATANKYYDGLIFGIPQLCTTGSHMGKMVKKAGIGLVCDPYTNAFLDQVYDYCTSLNRTEFLGNCQTELNRILREYKAGTDIIAAFVSSK